MIYDLLAPFYDAINAEIDYKKWADFIEKIFERECKSKPDLVLDLGCGTGKMTLEMAKRGYDMIGVDYSPEMLDIAREGAFENNQEVLLLCQDMREFELYGTVDAVLCCLDGINHLQDTQDVKKCFSLVHNYLNPDGIFVFDINGRYKFENIYSDRTYAMEEEGAVCIWENFYDEDSALCDFYITLFKECDDGRYERYDETQTERMYPLADVKNLLENAGMEFIGAYCDLNFNPGSDECERIYIVAKCRK